MTKEFRRRLMSYIARNAHGVLALTGLCVISLGVTIRFGISWALIVGGTVLLADAVLTRPERRD